MPKYDDYEDEIGPLSAAARESLATRSENINTNTTNTNIVTNDVSASLSAQAHAGAATASQGAESKVANTNTDWINNKYRPAMGWVYMAICIFDFILAPIAWTAIQAIAHGSIANQWAPLSLGGGGLLHVAFGAVIGISAFGRTREKLEGRA
jgi:hypothetical protein